MMPADEEHREHKGDVRKNQKYCRKKQWREEARVATAEACGTALLVLLSCLPAGAPPAVRAVAAGAVVAMLVQSFDHISGAMFNPVVTLAALVWGRVGGARAFCMVAAQVGGAAVGAAALRLLAATPAPASPPLGVTLPAPGYSLYKALCVEAAAGACLALANCAAWDARTERYRDSWPLRMGVTVAALSLVAVELTGASMNPARSFGPALLAHFWTAHWIYWVGPLSGSLAATLLYTVTWRPPPTCTPPPPPPSRPLSQQPPRLCARV